MAARQLSDLRSEGTTLGQSAADLVSMHGATPVAQVAITCVATGCVVATVLAKLNSLIGTLRTKGVIG